MRTKAPKTKAAKYYFFHRGGENPGVTVSKRDKLPDGDFRINEYIWQDWGYCVLWFIDDDRFTADEREQAYRQYAGR